MYKRQTLHGSPCSGPPTPEAAPASEVSALECSREPAVSAPVFSGMVAASYHKLPNPLSQIIQQLPVVDGLDVDKLLPFFKIIFQLTDFPGMSDRTILELVYPYCRGPMAERVAGIMRRSGGAVSYTHLDVYKRQPLDCTQ